MDDLKIAKKDLRKAAIARRAEAFARHGPQAGEHLAAQGIAFACLREASDVSAFLAIGEEIDPLPLMRRLWAAGHATGLPVMVGKDQPLEFRAWQEGEPLAEVKWGIREPLATARVMTPDVVLVPLLAFDRHGYRLGYGGGFYDRTLDKLRRETPRLVAIGLAFDELEIDAVPHDSHDQRLDWVLTPGRTVRCQE